MSETITVNNIQALTNGLEVAFAKHDNTVLYGEDAGFEGGVFRATVGLQAKFGERRVFDSPIAEATLAGTAVGMAMNGMRPVVEMQFEGFSYPALQQIFCHIARTRNRSRGRFTCPLVIRTPMGGGIRALEHHSEAMEAMLAHNPGLVVVIPSTPFDTKGLIIAAIESNDPVLFLEPTKIYRAFKQEIPADYYTLSLGEAYQITTGDDVTVVTYGAQVPLCQKVINQYMADNPNVSIELIDLRTIKPWDEAMVVASVQKTGRLVVVHEAVKSFSVASEIMATVSEKCFEHLRAPLMRVTGYDIMIPYDKGEKYHLISEERLSAGLKKTLAFQF